MKILEFFRLSISNLGHRQFRVFFTMIGIFIGITAVVAIISLGQGLQVAINEQFNELGTDKVFVQPGSGGAFSVAGNSSKLTEDDLRVIERTLGVQDIVGMGWKTSKVTRKDQDVFVLVMGYDLVKSSDLWNDMQKNNIEEGRLLEKDDTYGAFVGYNWGQEEKLFKRGANLGDKFIINGVDFKILGIQEDMGNSNDNNQVQISAEAYENVFGERIEDDYQWIVARVAEGVDPLIVADRIKKDLRRSRDVDEGDEDFQIQTAEEFLDSFNDILMIVNVVIVGIAAISLLIGGIGIMNTMYTAVVERTQEIGIMKAIGARNTDILSIFLIESGILGLVGGLVGVIIGLGISKAIEIFGALYIGTIYLRFWWSWELILGALAFTFILGMIAGFLPAYQASKQQAVDSLRYE